MHPFILTFYNKHVKQIQAITSSIAAINSRDDKPYDVLGSITDTGN